MRVRLWLVAHIDTYFLFSVRDVLVCVFFENIHFVVYSSNQTIIRWFLLLLSTIYKIYFAMSVMRTQFSDIYLKVMLHNNNNRKRFLLIPIIYLTILFVGQFGILFGFLIYYHCQPLKKI